jgi:hypothetical protein
MPPQQRDRGWCGRRPGRPPADTRSSFASRVRPATRASWSTPSSFRVRGFWIHQGHPGTTPWPDRVHPTIPETVRRGTARPSHMRVVQPMKRACR